MSSADPIRVVRPEVVPAQLFVFGPIIAGFAAVIPGFFAFVISNIVVMTPTHPVFGYALAAYAAGFFVVLGLCGAKTFIEPGRSSYSIYRERIDTEEGLYIRTRRTIPLAQVLDISLTEGVLQRTRGVGTIMVVVNQLAVGQQGFPTNRAYPLRNVPEPVEVYELIRSIALGE